MTLFSAPPAKKNLKQFIEDLRLIYKLIFFIPGSVKQKFSIRKLIITFTRV